jgi:aminoglycoside phosphotransferase (APT) family kinase protein
LTWLPVLAPQVTLRLPEPVAKGAPTDAYPHTWAVYRWLPGDPFGAATADDARSLARFVEALRQIDTDGAPKSTRDFHLRLLDPGARNAIEKLHDVIDTRAATASWETSLAGPDWDGTPVWIHGDLLPPNLLTYDGRLSAVLDFGCVGVGDPAVDVIPAWSVFDPHGRATYRAALDVDEETWIRARGYALHQALLIIPYYWETNRAFADMAMRTVGEVIADARAL